MVLLPSGNQSGFFGPASTYQGGISQPCLSTKGFLLVVGDPARDDYGYKNMEIEHILLLGTWVLFMFGLPSGYLT